VIATSGDSYVGSPFIQPPFGGATLREEEALRGRVPLHVEGIDLTEGLDGAGVEPGGKDEQRTDEDDCRKAPGTPHG
jgi:hypothetical protein